LDVPGGGAKNQEETTMFSVIFEVHPKPDQWDGYLGVAKMLRPELEQIDGFIENVRYKSLTRPGWLLSLSGWRDEKSVVRWRTAQRHHLAQERGRSTILLDYHLRVGEITQDTHVPAGHRIAEQRVDETEIGEGTTVTFVDAKWPNGSIETSDEPAIADHLALNPDAGGLLKWEVFDAVLTPGDVVLMMVWNSKDAATAFGASAKLPSDGRLRQVRVVRDYGMFDRREAPQYYPEASRHGA